MTAANEYAKALFLLAEEEKNTEETLRDIRLVKDAMTENPSYRSLLDTPSLPTGTKQALIDEAFASLTKHVRNLAKLLSDKHKFHLLPEIADAFGAMYDESRGNLRVTVMTAVPMTEKQCRAMGKKLEEQTGKHVFIENIVEPTILGGVVLRYAGVQLDSSVKMRLDAVEKSLKSLIL